MKHEKLTDLMSLILLGIFAVCILLVLLTGARVYRNLVDRGETGYQQRTAAQYIATRVRQGDGADAIRVEEFAGVDCLVLAEQIQGRTYLNRVYCHGGYIRELFTSEYTQADPEDGEKILRAEGLTLSLEGAVLKAAVTLPDGSVQTLGLYLRSEGGAGE